MVRNGSEIEEDQQQQDHRSFCIRAMELPKLLQRGASFRFIPRFHSAHNNAGRSACHKKIGWVAVLLIATTFLFFYFFKNGGDHHHGSSSKQQELQTGYGVVIDIGRVEARVNVLQYEEETGTDSSVAIKVLGSDRSGAPHNLPVVLYKFLEYANGLVPEVERARTRVYVLATGNLDWIPELNRVAFLEECRKSGRESGYLFRDEWVLVTNGREEGVYEWVAANYARSMVKVDPTDTIGVLHLGDESAEVVFVPEKAPPAAYSSKVELWGRTHDLYSYSFDKVGLETASKSLLDLLHARVVAAETGSTESKLVLDPCSPRGFRGPNHFGNERVKGSGAVKQTFLTVPSGNFTNCRAESVTLLKQGQEACHDETCPDGTYFIPELRGNFIATGKFYEVAKGFSLPAMTSSADFVAAGERYCGGEVGGTIKEPFPAYETVRKPCFSAAFIVAFLHDRLGLSLNGNKVMLTNIVNSVPLEWTMGFFLTHSLEGTKRTPSFITSILKSIMSTNFALFLGIIVTFGGLFWFVAGWRGPQLKTIYDLEKGRYFTRGGR